MTKNSSWIRKRQRDQYFRLAKEKGYRSRAAFKLKQIIRSYKFIARGDRVIELGAAPGGWTQVVAETVGNNGYVLGVDVQPISPLDYPQVGFVTLDIASELAAKTITDKLPAKVDVVLSDMSPNISGTWELDHSRQIHLARKSFEIAQLKLRIGGNFLVKVFQGSELDTYLQEVRTSFRTVRLVRPPATRASSAELYVLGLGYLGMSEMPQNYRES
ncbi:MAG: RlmE family RNA methyltransferase [Candidatus Bathyarchaeota archaeon]|jgi:23S rRNA (uridine2552-2'-O)-methyltransferase|nr:RlmE family RNA methyltransferase [Candidatus Bathyarchaeota archaeon]